jgi:DNA-binding XRE family transcriptional regulator
MPANKSAIRNSEAGLTMEDLAKLAGVSKITVSAGDC